MVPASKRTCFASGCWAVRAVEQKKAKDNDEIAVLRLSATVGNLRIISLVNPFKVDGKVDGKDECEIKTSDAIAMDYSRVYPQAVWPALPERSAWRTRFLRH